jgi:hypothetical protein
VAVLIADTGYQLYAACETVRDLDHLYADFGVDGEVQEDAMHSVCDPELSDAEGVWGGVVEKSGEWLDQVRAAMPVGTPYLGGHRSINSETASGFWTEKY